MSKLLGRTFVTALALLTLAFSAARAVPVDFGEMKAPKQLRVPVDFGEM